MTAIATNYLVIPFSGMFLRILRAFEISGYMKAARELNRLGYYEEAKSCSAQADALKRKH